ncbi:MAG: methyltransferase domain-containing protein [Actinobacteria bacterium]|nr:methyltransferase domain-containing protein [Actinomycetota bacterium]
MSDRDGFIGFGSGSSVIPVVISPSWESAWHLEQAVAECARKLTMEYALQFSPQERSRYRLMAATARVEEAAIWSAAGIGPAAVVADIGCGPGAVLRLLAEQVGPAGRAQGVDFDAEAVTAATEEVGDLEQASVRQGEAIASGLEPGSFDVVMCRHVLAHNGGQEETIVSWHI